MLHMKEDETIDTFTTKLTTLVNKAASLGHTMEDGTLVRKLLNAVPDRYMQIVASIEQYSDLSEMNLEEAIGRLKTYKERIKYKKGKQVHNQEKLMFTRHENKGKCFRERGRRKHRFSQGRNHENFKEEKKDEETSHKNVNKNNFKKSNYDTSKLQCYKCKKIGHVAPKCPQRTKPNEQSKLVEEDLKPTLLMAILEDEEQKVLLHEEDVGYKETNKDSLWYLDNEASNHMTGVREHFKELNEKVSGKKDYMSEHINDEPEWTDFKIGNLEVTNEHHDQGFQPIEEDNEFPNSDDDDYASPTRHSPTHSQTPQTPQTPSTRSSKVNSQVTPNISTQSNYQSDNVSIQTINSPSHFDHTPVRAMMETIRLLLAIAANNKWEVHHLDVKSAFLHRDLKEEVLLSRFMQEPREQHMKAIRQVLRYVKGTKDHGITYKHNGGNKIHGYNDSSYGVNTQEGKGTTGVIFYYGESPISWSTQKQATVALSSCESEFIVATTAATQALWLKRLLSKLTHSEEDKVTIRVDNKSAIALMKNPVFYGRSKHIDTKYHFIRECVEREDIQVKFVSGEYQKADILTKALPKIKFLTMRQLIGLKDLRHSVCD
nr:ribonuclease H-like domain, reverse transcriptase, RNA-dependent DNA polymerase [Tanacetum cinerariifolium]